MKVHSYKSHLAWTGNTGDGTQDYKSYLRSYQVKIEGKQAFLGSSDPAFMGDPTKHNPEELLLMALSSCHMLWYLHLCSINKIVVEEYNDSAIGSMIENPDGSGEFKEAILRPIVKISDGDKQLAKSLHQKANEMCFIARSVNFKVDHQPQII
ncbi:MAG: OsmC family protein [Cyclobacteriaceae bacterium]